MIDLIGLIRMAFWELWKGFMDLPSTFNHGGAYTRWSISISVRGFGIAMFGPVLTLYLVNVFHASKPEIGALTSIAFLVRLLGAPFLGIMVDRHGPKRLMIIGLLLAVVHPIVFSTIPGVSYLFIVYVVSGLYWAFINASWFTWQMNLIPSNRGVYAGFFSFINGLAWAFGPLFGGFLGDVIGLRYCALLSLSIVFLSLLIMLKVPETLEEVENPSHSLQVIQNIT